MNGAAQQRQDLPLWLWAGFPPLMLLLLVGAHFIAPEMIPVFTRRDDDAPGGHIVEHGTVVVLIPGIIAGFAVFLARHRLPDWRLGWWVLMWTLACVYFAGEEVSWGQHLFDWETPESYKAINRQQEMNLHNTTSWLNEKPRALVELWIMIAGFGLPLWRLATSARLDPARLGYWLWPTVVAAPSAALFLLFRVHKWVADATGARVTNWLSESEVREYYIALFLSLYLLSIWKRLRAPR